MEKITKEQLIIEMYAESRYGAYHHTRLAWKYISQLQKENEELRKINSDIEDYATQKIDNLIVAEIEVLKGEKHELEKQVKRLQLEKELADAVIKAAEETVKAYGTSSEERLHRALLALEAELKKYKTIKP